jgi:hypothetical protein
VLKDRTRACTDGQLSGLEITGAAAKPDQLPVFVAACMKCDFALFASRRPKVYISACLLDRVNLANSSLHQSFYYTKQLLLESTFAIHKETPKKLPQDADVSLFHF